MQGGSPQRFIIIKRKDFPLAVMRNKIKRRIKFIISKQPLSTTKDLYIRVLKGANNATYNELNEDILNALEVQK